jgi:hypothetical protein
MLGAGAQSASAEHSTSPSSGAGAAGTGGESSGGKAQGFRLEKPSTTLPDTTYTNSGSQIGGLITLTGASEGMGAGAYTPQEVIVGHFTGAVSDVFGIGGTCNGVCG